MQMYINSYQDGVKPDGTIAKPPYRVSKKYISILSGTPEIFFYLKKPLVANWMTGHLIIVRLIICSHRRRKINLGSGWAGLPKRGERDLRKRRQKRKTDSKSVVSLSGGDMDGIMQYEGGCVLLVV